MSDFQKRLEDVRKRIEGACKRAGRSPDQVAMLAVSKTFGPEDVTEAAGCGLTVFGESKVQEARQKIPLCPENLEWHLIGHLQTNKIKDAVHLFRVIHAVDSLRLLEMINRISQEACIRIQVCLEVNVSGEGSKYGMKPGEVLPALECATRCSNVEVVGLMTIPPFTPDPEGARHFFRVLRRLRDDCRVKSGFPLEHLSMGMSHDFEIAIEEGATWIRLGSVLFGERKKVEAAADGCFEPA